MTKIKKQNYGTPRERVRYRTSTDDLLRCSGCAFFAQGRCSQVTPIEVEDGAVCDLYTMAEALRPEWSCDEESRCDVTSVWLQKQDAMRYTLGVVYEPDVPDTYGHHATADVIEAAAWEFLANGPMAGYGHIEDEAGQAVGLIVESYIYRGPAWTIPAADGQMVTIQAGTWLLGTIWTPAYWAKIESGEATGLSLDGRAWFDAA